MGGDTQNKNKPEQREGSGPLVALASSLPQVTWEKGCCLT